MGHSLRCSVVFSRFCTWCKWPTKRPKALTIRSGIGAALVTCAFASTSQQGHNKGWATAKESRPGTPPRAALVPPGENPLDFSYLRGFERGRADARAIPGLGTGHCGRLQTHPTGRREVETSRPGAALVGGS